MDTLLQELLDRGVATGIAAAVVTSSGSETRTFGTASRGGESLRADHVLEIGSITKAFTGIMLARLVEEGVVRLDDTLGALHPAELPEPMASITLEQLATHRSGLPPLPRYDHQPDPLNPYVGFTAEGVLEGLATTELAAPPGEAFSYSNFGMGVLGNLLARAAGDGTYEQAIRRLVLEPLGMRDTGVLLSLDQQRRAAQGHTPLLEATPFWDLPAVAGAGALRSTAQDMLTFIAANLAGQAPAPLAAALRLARRPRAEADESMRVGLAWIVQDDGLVWHNGGTGGYRTFLGLRPEDGFGIFLAANGVADEITALGMAAVRALPSDDVDFMLPPFVEPTAGRLDAYAGTYEVAPGLRVLIDRADSRLRATVPGQGELALEAVDDEGNFLARGLPGARFTFESDPPGRIVVTGMGPDQVAVRVDT